VPQPSDHAWSAPPPERDPGPGRVPGDPPPSESAPVTDKLHLDDAPADRFCDLVMEGGVTSGIIYATAVARLAGHYRFRSIGGSSIGAFAAALAAAAEYQRRRGSTAGFDMLRGLPSELADNKADGRTLLERLFQPQPGTRRLFQVFRAGLGRRSFLSKLASVGRSLLWQYRVVIAVAVIVLILLPTLPGLLGWMQVCSLWSVFATECAGWTTAWLFMGLPALVEVVVFALLAGLGWDLVRGMVSNGYGLCRGWGRDHTIFKPTGHGPVPDLAGFLHGAIQKAAGRDPLDDLPLTFEDLWMAPGGPTEMLDYEATGAGARSIDLQVYASNLAQNRPYRLPLDLHPHGSEGEDDDMGRLYFKPDELADYFPRGIVDYMTAVSSPYRRRSGEDPPEDAPSTKGCRELPVEKLPIVVAARLAMSFPFLVSAIPLWAIRHPPKEKGQRLMQRCWMSDGGLCSNFPIHLFDGWIPKWPTFGISLLKRPNESEGPDVWLPDCHREGRADTWNETLGAEATGPTALWGFISSLFVTIWRWNDATTMRMPGVRDRVVRVYLDEEEGGVNIRMTPGEIDNLAQRYGEKVADVLIERFARPASRGWNEHRWIRFNTLLLALRERVQGLRVASEEGHHAVPLPEQIELSVHEAPLKCRHHPPGHGPTDDPIAPEEAVDLQVLLHHLIALEAAFARRGQRIPFDAIPFPSLRIRHPT
jgi:predicted acylesterase/phospholipase RssA